MSEQKLGRVKAGWRERAAGAPSTRAGHCATTAASSCRRLLSLFSLTVIPQPSLSLSTLCSRCIISRFWSLGNHLIQSCRYFPFLILPMPHYLTPFDFPFSPPISWLEDMMHSPFVLPSCIMSTIPPSLLPPARVPRPPFLHQTSTESPCCVTTHARLMHVSLILPAIPPSTA